MVTGHPYLETKHWERNIIIHMWCVYIIYYIILYTVYVYTVYKYVHPDMFSILRSSDSDIFLGISSDTYSDIYHISWHFFCQILSHILWNADSVWHLLTFVLTSILHIQILPHLSYHIYDIYHISWHCERQQKSWHLSCTSIDHLSWHILTFWLGFIFHGKTTDFLQGISLTSEITYRFCRVNSEKRQCLPAEDDLTVSGNSLGRGTLTISGWWLSPTPLKNISSPVGMIIP